MFTDVLHLKGEKRSLVVPGDSDRGYARLPAVFREMNLRSLHPDPPLGEDRMKNGLEKTAENERKRGVSLSVV